MVMPNRVLKMPAAAGPDSDKAVPVHDGRQTVPADPEFSKRRRRRSFSAQEKLRILEETDRAAETGGVGAILRRDGIPSSSLTEWRRQRAAGTLTPLAPTKRGPKAAPSDPLAAEPAAERWKTHACASVWSARRRSSTSKRTLKHQPLFPERIEAHIFVAFDAYCLQVTLKLRLRALAPGLAPQAVLEKLGNPDGGCPSPTHRWTTVHLVALHLS